MGLDDFARVLHGRMDFFNNDPEADKLRRVKGEVDQVKAGTDRENDCVLVGK
jgi:hypothetical protein